MIRHGISDVRDNIVYISVSLDEGDDIDCDITFKVELPYKPEGIPNLSHVFHNINGSTFTVVIDNNIYFVEGDATNSYFEKAAIKYLFEPIREYIESNPVTYGELEYCITLSRMDYKSLKPAIAEFSIFKNPNDKSTVVDIIIDTAKVTFTLDSIGKCTYKINNL